MSCFLRMERKLDETHPFTFSAKTGHSVSAIRISRRRWRASCRAPALLALAWLHCVGVAAGRSRVLGRPGDGSSAAWRARTALYVPARPNRCRPRPAGAAFCPNGTVFVYGQGGCSGRRADCSLMRLIRHALGPAPRQWEGPRLQPSTATLFTSSLSGVGAGALN